MTTVSPSHDERVLVTGALGCIGSWVVKMLLAEGSQVVALDAGGSEHRLAELVGAGQQAGLTKVTGDIRDRDVLDRVLDEHEITAVIHLAGLQVPACKADPARGAEVNVVGTVNVFEAVSARSAMQAPIVYASSVAAYGSETEGSDRLQGEARTLYGVYKRANEGSARVYWADHQVASVGLRPYVVYGPGRDFGVTSEPTFAMKAAAQGEPYTISYGGFSHMQFAEDVARDFIAASRSGHRGASVVNLAGSVVHMSEVVRAIEVAKPAMTGQISFVDEQLPFPGSVDTANAVFVQAAETPLADGVRRTIEHFEHRAALVGHA